MLRVDLVDYLQDQLLHHEGGRIRQIDAMVEVFRLGLLGVPDLLWDRLAKASVNLDVRKLQLLVDIAEVLTVENDKDVPLRE